MQQMKQKIKTKTDKDKKDTTKSHINAQGNLNSARPSSRVVHVMGPLGSQPMIHSNNTSIVIESQEINTAAAAI